jgi:hypothetical protein
MATSATSGMPVLLAGVNTYQYIEITLAQAADYFSPLNGINIRMHVTYLDNLVHVNIP